MKKIVLTLAVAFAATSAFAQSTADDGTIRTQDQVLINGSLTMLDMIDLVPEGQIASNTVGTWAAYNNGVQLNETGNPAPNPPNNYNPLNDIEFRVSATRPFTVTIANGTWTRANNQPNGFPNNAPTGVENTIAANAFYCLGLPSPEMTGTVSGSGYAISGQWQGNFGTAAMNNTSSTATLSSSAQTVFKANGCYNRQFDLRIGIKGGYAYNRQGLYNGTITLLAALN